MNSGEAFHIRSPGSNEEHLYVALTPPDRNGNLVMVNVTSQRPGKDQSCVLHVGDHRFIKRVSVINYAEATITSENAILEGARGGLVRFDDPATRAVLARIQKGALASPHTESKVKDMVKTALGN